MISYNCLIHNEGHIDLNSYTMHFSCKQQILLYSGLFSRGKIFMNFAD